MKRSLIAICILLALSLCACQPDAASSSSAVSEDVPSSSAAASSENASSSDSSEASSEAASSAPAEKLDLEVDWTIDFDTLNSGEYINNKGELVTDKAFAEWQWKTGSYYAPIACATAEDYYEYRHNRFGATENISTAVLYWGGVLSGGRICGFTPDAIPSGNEDEYEELRKQSTDIIASWTDITAVPSVSLREICYPWAYSKDTRYSINPLGKLSTLSEPLPAEAIDAYPIDDHLWLNPDGTLYYDYKPGINLELSFDEYSNVVSAYPDAIYAEPWGYYLLLSDGTYCYDNGQGSCQTIQENIVKSCFCGNFLTLNSYNEVFERSSIPSGGLDTVQYEKIGIVSDWHNVVYLKGVGGAIVAAMKDGTVEVVSPGDAPQVLLDFFNSITDLKVTQ